MTTLTAPTTRAASTEARRDVSGAAASAHRRELRLAAAIQSAWLRDLPAAPRR